MTTSAHGAAGSWSGKAWAPEADSPDDRPGDAGRGYDLRPDDGPDGGPQDGFDDGPDDWGPPEEVQPRAPSAPRTRVHESAAEGLSGRGLIVASALAVGGCAVLDLALTSGQMTFFFDLCFVVICLVATMAVRRQDLFTAGVLPPLVFAAVIAVVAVAAPHAFQSAPGVNKVFLTGLASHASGLVGGYAVALLAVAARLAASESRRR